MASLGKIVTTLEAQSDAFTKGTNQAESDLEKFRKKVQQTKTEVGGLRGVLDSLKSGAGRGSTLDELGKTLRGGYAVAGITLLGEGLKNATGKAAELTDQFRKGQIDGTGLAVGIGKSIPILGSFVEAGQNIREMFTHEKSQIDDINKTAELGNAIMETRVKLVHDATNAVREWGKIAAEANAKVVESMLPPEARKKYEVDFSFAQKQDDLKHQFDEQMKGIDDSVKAERDKLQPVLNQMRQELLHASAGSAEWKTLNTNITQLVGTMLSLTNAAKDQQQKITDAAKAASIAIVGEQRAAERSPVIEYLDDLQKKLDDLKPDSVGKVRDEIYKLGGGAGEVQKALDLLAKTKAEETYKKNTEGLKEWSKQLDETAAKIDALQQGADEKVAEQWAKLHTDDAGQRDMFAQLNQRQQAEDAALKTIEQQKKVVEEMTSLQREAAQVGMTEAKKKLDDLKRDGANDAQLKQADALQKQSDAAEQFKKDSEDAKRLIESSMSPLEKFKDETDKINALYTEGLLTAQQASEAIDKQGKELGKANKDENKHAGAEVRRFDFRLPQEPKHADPAAQQVALAKQNLAIQQQIQYYLQQLYNFGQDDQQDQNTIINF
jgi:hypothetical protein